MINLSDISKDVLNDCLKRSDLFRNFIVDHLINGVGEFKAEIERRILLNKFNKIAAIKAVREFAVVPGNGQKLHQAFPDAGFFNSGISLADCKAFVERYI